MPRFKKQILAPGTYVTRSGPVNITAADCGAFASTGNAMLAANVQVPVPLEHQPLAKPTMEDSLSDLVRFNTGFVRGYELDSDSGLWADLEVNSIPMATDHDVHLLTDPEQVKHFVENNVRFVSPELLPSFRDGRGRVWEDVISHVALTPVPVWHDQVPFGEQAAAPATVAMSLGDDKFSWRKRQQLRLSLADMWAAPVGTLKSATLSDLPIKLSQHVIAPAGGAVYAGIFYRGGTPLPKNVLAASMLPVKVAETNGGKLSMADEPNLFGGDAAPDGNGGKAADGDAGKADAGKPEPKADKGGGKDKDLIDGLRDVAEAEGLVISDSVSSLRDAVEHLITAFKTSKATKGMGDDKDKDADAGADAKPAEEPQVVAMSQTPAPANKPAAAPAPKSATEVAMEKKLADLEAKYTAQLSILQKHNEDANGRAADAELRTLLSTIDNWVKDGYVTPARWNPYKETLTAKKLSLVSGNDNDVNAILDRARVVAEMIRDGDLKKGNTFRPDEGTEVPQPEHAKWLSFSNEPMTRDKVKETLKELDVLLGRPAQG